MNQEPTQSKPATDGQPSGEGLQSTALFGVTVWNFETRGGEIWVCEGDHDKSESCSTNSREVFAAEAIEIIEKLRRETLKFILHNNPHGI